MPSIYEEVGQIKGIGVKTKGALQKLGIFTIEDLLTYYPFRFTDLRENETFDFSTEEKVVLKGEVIRPCTVQFYGGKKSRASFVLFSQGRPVRVTFFNQPFLKKQIRCGEEIAIYGKWNPSRNVLSGIKIVPKTKEEWEPIYHASKEIKAKTIQKWIQVALEQFSSVLPEILPQKYLEKYRLCSRKEALHWIHQPQTKTEYQQARRRLAYEEAFLWQLQLKELKKQEATENATHSYNNEQLKAFIRTLPYELTQDQKKVMNEICRDMKKSQPMNRLIQGDVGCGKTIVAILAAYVMTTAGKQTALMVPTEILAEQHFKNMEEVLPSDIHYACLTGSTPKKEREAIEKGLEEGTIDIVVGTHAIMQKEIHYADLGLAIIDEQHRFGVRQRQALIDKGEAVDILMMTATPIPRTLAQMTAGYLDISTIKTLPAGRKPIQTYYLSFDQKETILEQMTQTLARGEQIYVVCPLIEESEALSVQNATAVYEEIQARFPDYQVGLLHGKIKGEEKDQLMRQFSNNEIQVLISTTVIEVGVNVPNATCMIIQDADRFGVAQLHQLRGRVGRGEKPSTCLLLSNAKNAEAIQRLRCLEETTDGFVLSQFDLEQRGPGDFLGERQSGLWQFKLLQPEQDAKMIACAMEDVAEFTMKDWKKEDQNQPLVYWLEQHQKTYGW